MPFEPIANAEIKIPKDKINYGYEGPIQANKWYVFTEEPVDIKKFYLGNNANEDAVCYFSSVEPENIFTTYLIPSKLASKAEFTIPIHSNGFKVQCNQDIWVDIRWVDLR